MLCCAHQGMGVIFILQQDFIVRFCIFPWQESKPVQQETILCEAQDFVGLFNNF